MKTITKNPEIINIKKLRRNTLETRLNEGEILKIGTSEIIFDRITEKKIYLKVLAEPSIIIRKVRTNEPETR